MLLSRMTKSEAKLWRATAGTWMDELQEETLASAIARVKAETLTDEDEDAGELELDEDDSDDDGGPEEAV